jgi:hypothetical protein
LSTISSCSQDNSAHNFILPLSHLLQCCDLFSKSLPKSISHASSSSKSTPFSIPPPLLKTLSFPSVTDNDLILLQILQLLFGSAIIIGGNHNTVDPNDAHTEKKGTVKEKYVDEDLENDFINTFPNIGFKSGGNNYVSVDFVLNICFELLKEQKKIEKNEEKVKNIEISDKQDKKNIYTGKNRAILNTIINSIPLLFPSFGSNSSFSNPTITSSLTQVKFSSTSLTGISPSPLQVKTVKNDGNNNSSSDPSAHLTVPDFCLLLLFCSSLMKHSPVCPNEDDLSCDEEIIGNDLLSKPFDSVVKNHLLLLEKVPSTSPPTSDKFQLMYANTLMLLCIQV